MIANADVTIYNKYYDRVTEKDIYLRSYLYSVNWQGARAVNVGDKGVTTADYTDVLIPADVDAGGKTFLKPKAWKNATDKDSHFTLNAGDIIVKGIVGFEITGVKPNNLDGLRNGYDDVMDILSVVDLTDASLPHWEIGAK